VANHVETEVILEKDVTRASMIIVRGSVPVFWEQQGLQVGGHKIQISRSREATQVNPLMLHTNKNDIL